VLLQLFFLGSTFVVVMQITLVKRFTLLQKKKEKQRDAKTKQNLPHPPNQTLTLSFLHALQHQKSDNPNSHKHHEKHCTQYSKNQNKKAKKTEGAKTIP
jgi:hypothetical protein